MNFVFCDITHVYIAILSVVIIASKAEELDGVSAFANLGQNDARSAPQGVDNHADAIDLDL